MAQIDQENQCYHGFVKENNANLRYSVTNQASGRHVLVQ